MNNLQDECLLTTEQIAAILAAADDPAFKIPLAIHFGVSIFSIIRVSATGGLIFVKGNEYTGMTHIIARHSYHSLKRTWQMHPQDANKEEFILDDPSRFRPGSVPIFDYVNIAEEIFLNGLRDDIKNNRPELFDKYIGSFTYSDGKAEKHVLILYKNTKIVHTLFPQKSINNRPKLRGFHFSRGGASASQDLKSGIITVIIPYYNQNQHVCYSIEIIFNGHKLTKECFLFAHNSKGEPEQGISLGSQPHSGIVLSHLSEAMLGVQYGDFRYVEQLIKDTESGKIPRLSELP